MKEKSLTRDYWEAWVLPILAAQLAAAVLMVELLQVDWTVDCSTIIGGCETEVFRALFGWLPIALAYGAFHIWGARRLVKNAKFQSTLLRFMSIPVFVAIHLLPVPGFVLFYVGVAGGFAIALTVIGLVVSPVVGFLTAEFFAGAMLGLFAGPPFAELDWRSWRSLLLYYGYGGALGSTVLMLCVGALMLSHGLFDRVSVNPFSVYLSWLPIVGTLITVAAVGAITSHFAQMGWVKAGLIEADPLVSPADYKQAAILVVPLTVLVSLMVASGSTLFRRDGAPFPALAAMLRGDRPGIPIELKVADLTYVGRRGQIFSRGIVKRDRMEFHVENKGMPDEVSVGTTVYDEIEEWQLKDTNSSESITVTADASSLQVTLECEPGLIEGEEFCSDDNYPRRENLQKTFAIAYGEDAYLRSVYAPNAALAIRFDNRLDRGDDKRNWARLYCRLNLVNVTSAKFSAIQIVPCEVDWVSAADQLRARLEGDFVASAATPEPVQP
jgi:hypothetical protein